MHDTSQTYKDLLALPYVVENKVIIDGTTYTEAALVSVNVSGQVFAVEAPSVGNAVSRMITLEMLDPGDTIPAQAKIELFSRLRYGDTVSEWLPKGVFYVDTRSIGQSTGGESTTIIIEGYDAILKGEQTYTPAGDDWPHTDAAVLSDICALIGVESDFTPGSGYSITKPAEYSVREMLGYIAAMYGGSFVMNDAGRLQLIPLNAGAGDPAPALYSRLAVGDRLAPIRKVRLHRMDGTVYEVGNSTGRTLNADCPWATSAMAAAILTVVNGFEYQPFTASDTLIDPAVEIGDRVLINGSPERIFEQNITYGKGLYATLGAMAENEINHDYPYMPSGLRGAYRAAAEAKGEVNRVEREFTAEVGNVRAGLRAIASDYQISQWQTAETSLFAELVDANGHIKAAWINETVISDGTHAKSLIDMLADIISLNGEIVVIGNMSIQDGVLVVDQTMSAKTVIAQVLRVPSADGETLNTYVPTSITLTNGQTRLALGH